METFTFTNNEEDNVRLLRALLEFLFQNRDKRLCISHSRNSSHFLKRTEIPELLLTKVYATNFTLIKTVAQFEMGEKAPLCDPNAIWFETGSTVTFIDPGTITITRAGTEITVKEQYPKK